MKPLAHSRSAGAPPGRDVKGVREQACPAPPSTGLDDTSKGKRPGQKAAAPLIEV
jgi:hypothetical protein